MNELLLRRRALMMAQKKSRLPSEYQEVEYLESTGTQYINTGHIPSTKFVIDVDFDSTKAVGESFQAIYGCQEGGTAVYTRISMIIISTNDKVRLVTLPDGFVDTDIILPSNTWINNRRMYHLDLQGVAKVDDLQANTRAIGSTPQIPLYILARNDASSDEIRCAKGRLYGAKWTDGTGSCKLIACYRKSDHKPGMYDLVSKTFFTNAGTGEFLVGADVN